MLTHDIPEEFKPPGPADHERRECMVPMRDGVKLRTVVLVPFQAGSRTPVAGAPAVLDRTPYAADKWTRLSASTRGALALHAIHGELLEAGYIVVLQDVRGKDKSEGDYVLNRPPRGPLNGGQTDHATDAYDTIEWLVTQVAESNGRVATLGISYDGFTVLMSLIDPHPALKAAVPINPMVDNWIGDDWFHNGAFRQTITAQYLWRQTGSKASEHPWPLPFHDEYAAWLEAGSAGAMAERLGLDRLPAWQRMAQHPAYDAFWQSQAVDRMFAGRPLSVPTLHVHSQWDAEDSYGAMAVHAAMEPQDADGTLNRLVIGPWSHPGVGVADGAAIGALRLGSDTARHFRRDMLLPFLEAHLREGAPAHGLSRVHAFESGSNRWLAFDRWPPACVQARPFYAHAQSVLRAEPPAPPADNDPGWDEYVSDPAKPVPHQPRPVRPKGAPGAVWDDWLVGDQRFAECRPDVLSYRSAVLAQPLRLAGQPVVHLYASTSGADADWVVKLIDVYPDEMAGEVSMGGYQLPLAMEILRARYRDDPAHPSPVPCGEVLRYTIRLPHVCHALRRGHRLMLQIQSTWFPLYDRNPQSWVDNIFFAPPQAYVKATQRVCRQPGLATCIELPILPA